MCRSIKVGSSGTFFQRWFVPQNVYVISGCIPNIIVCLTFTEVEVRLSGMDTPNAGHVQVKYNSTWGTICAGRGLTYQTAEVICRQLGHGLPVKHAFAYKECTAKNEGAERVWLSQVYCRGFEDSIDQCPHRGWGRLDLEGCSYCTPQRCSVCLICQPRDANMTGIVTSVFAKKNNLSNVGQAYLLSHFTFFGALEFLL